MLAVDASQFPGRVSGFRVPADACLQVLSFLKAANGLFLSSDQGCLS